MRRALYPGSFDPVTHGHIDLIGRALELFDEIIIAIAENDAKTPLFSLEERVGFVRQSLPKEDRVQVVLLKGLLADYARENKIYVAIRGLRAVSDFEYEFQMALMNRHLYPKLETVFLTSKEDYTYLSSRLVKEVARLGGDISQFVPPFVAEAFFAKGYSRTTLK